ncbi:MAG: hypothetical protein ACMUJM_24495 [bacterium]
MNKNKSLIVSTLIIFLFSLFSISYLDASMYQYELKELVNESNIIVIGDVIETELITNPYDIHTKITLEVEENIFSKGEQISVGDNLVFLTPDKIDTPGVWTSKVFAKFSIGETVLVFLTRDSFQLKLLGSVQGKYTIEEGDQSEEFYAIDYSGNAQELSELKNRIQEIADNQGGYDYFIQKTITNDPLISSDTIDSIPDRFTVSLSDLISSWDASNRTSSYSYFPTSDAFFTATKIWPNSLNTNLFTPSSSFSFPNFFNYSQTTQQTTSPIKDWYINQQQTYMKHTQDNQESQPQTFLPSSPLDNSPFLIWTDPTTAYDPTTNSHIYVHPRADFWGNWYF